MTEFYCPTCDGWHEGTEAHKDQWSGAQLYAVTCPTDGLTEWFNMEWITRPAAARR